MDNDDWNPFERGSGARSSWHRLEGPGEPDDFSAGSSAAGDYRGPKREPIPQVIAEAFEDRPEPYVPQPRPPTPDRPKYPPVDPARSFLAWLATTRRALEGRIHEEEDQ